MMQHQILSVNMIVKNIKLTLITSVSQIIYQIKLYLIKLMVLLKIGSFIFGFFPEIKNIN